MTATTKPTKPAKEAKAATTKPEAETKANAVPTPAEIEAAKKAQAEKDAAAKAEREAAKAAQKAKDEAAKAEKKAAAEKAKAEAQAAKEAKAKEAAEAKAKAEAERTAKRTEAEAAVKTAQEAFDAAKVKLDEAKQALRALGGSGSLTLTGSSTDALRLAATRYVRDTEHKTASGNPSVDNGDELAQRLRGLTLEQVYEEAAEVLETDVATLKTKYAGLNPGMQRMNLGNRIRGVLNAK